MRSFELLVSQRQAQSLSLVFVSPDDIKRFEAQIIQESEAREGMQMS